MFLFLFSALLFSAQQNQVQNMEENNQIEMQNTENNIFNETQEQEINESERIQEELKNQTKTQEQENNETQIKNTEKEIVKEQAKIIKNKENKTQIQNENITANTEMNIIQDENKVNVQLSNGRNAEIKIMPNTASETAIERLSLKVCSEDNNCTIELKEVGTGNESKAAYEVKAEKKAKLFGFLETKMQVKAQVNAENGEVMSEERPWWAFLAIEEDE